MTRYLRLNRIAFIGPGKDATLSFSSGLNVICGASDTGKSFLAESVDFMLGGSHLRDIPERTPYNEIQLDLETTGAEAWRFCRATQGGNFRAIRLGESETPEETLGQKHGHDRTDTLSGFLLNKIGLNAKRILRSKIKGTTQSLSFRNLARLVIVQEGEIQQTGSPFWSGQPTQKTSDIAAIKLLLTGVDDSTIVSTTQAGQDGATQIALIDELLEEVRIELADVGGEKEDLEDQLTKIGSSIEAQQQSLESAQRELDALLVQRRELVARRSSTQSRVDEISDHLNRFDLLRNHYDVDEERLRAILESGSTFVHAEAAPCPLCGAPPETQQHEEACDGDVAAIVQAASAEIGKIERLRQELQTTVQELRH